MKLSFSKMTGAGNDFVMVDNRTLSLALTRQQIADLCDRHFGIGADGLLAVEPGAEGADFRMRYYNSDGGEAEMCGNGARCFAQYLRHLGAVQGARTTFDTPAGRITALYGGNDGSGEVAVNLTAPRDIRLRQPVATTQGTLEISSVNTGVPHAVVFVPDVEKVDLPALGSELRYHAAFAPKGTNVNFVQVTGPDSIRIRTYERGVEAETLACGTGVAAAAILSHLVEGLSGPVKVRVEGRAVLEVAFDRADQDGAGFRNVLLKGPAVLVFNGEIEWN